MIGQLCTCDVENFGDLLYPVIFQKLTEKHGITTPIIPLSFMRGTAPYAAGYLVHGINEQIQSSSLSHLVIGGGDVLRTDVDTVAAHYGSTYEKYLGQNFWSRMKQCWLGRRHRRYLKTEFVKKYMSYSPIAPFILDAGDCPQVGSILYCSCGAPFPFPPEKASTIRAAFESAAFVYVRDFQSKHKLQAAGVSRQIEVAPDLIVTLGDFFNRDVERRKGLALLAGYGVDTTKDVLCFQSSPQSSIAARELLQQLIALKKKTGAEIVLLPIGPCHGDDVFLRQLAEKSSGALTYIAVNSIYEIISVIAASRLFIGTSMHGNITAFSFGIPHLFGPIAVDKAEGFLEIAGLGGDFKLGSWSQLADKEAMVIRLPQDYFADKAAIAKKAVNATFEKMVKILQATAPQQNR